MTRRRSRTAVAPRRPATAKRIGSRGGASTTAGTTMDTVEHLVLPARQAGSSAESSAITVRHHHPNPPGLRLASDRDLSRVTRPPADPAVATSVRPNTRTGALAGRPVMAPEALLRRRPFRRHIEESRPYLVLAEGMRMINAHPIAVMVFWGGLTNWVLGAILAGHHVAGAIRPAVAGVVVIGWLVITLTRIGKLRELGESVQAIRALPAGSAPWADLMRRGGSALSGELPAPEARLLTFARRSEGAPLLTGRLSSLDGSVSSPEQDNRIRRADDHWLVRQGEEYGL